MTTVRSFCFALLIAFFLPGNVNAEGVGDMLLCCARYYKHKPYFWPFTQKYEVKYPRGMYFELYGAKLQTARYSFEITGDTLHVFLPEPTPEEISYAKKIFDPAPDTSGGLIFDCGISGIVYINHEQGAMGSYNANGMMEFYTGIDKKQFRLLRYILLEKNGVKLISEIPRVSH